MAAAKVITVTGIPGAQSTKFCHDYYEAKKSKAVIYDTGELIFQLAQNYPEEPPIPRGNLLNQPPVILRAQQGLAFETVLRWMEEDRKWYEKIVIDTHAQFLWGSVYHNAYNWKYLNAIASDLFITIIDKPSSIKAQQMQTETGRLQNNDLRDLVFWQNIEVNVTQGWAANYGKPMYVLPRLQEPIIIDSLLENCFLIYFQMPMTDASTEQDIMISAFKEKLLAVGREINGLPTPLIDPRYIDIETHGELTAITESIIRGHTVHRDLNWYIKQSSDLVAFYPEGTTISKGVTDETTRGFETGKNTYVVFPFERTSPFMDISKQVFRTESEFFDFYIPYMKQRMELLNRARIEEEMRNALCARRG